MNSSTKIAGERKQDKRIHRNLNLAYIYLKNSEFADAEKHAREYVAQEASDRGYRLLGDILRAQNKRDEALEAYERSLRLNSQQEDVLSLVCDLITPDITNCDRLAFWASRAAKSGFLDVAEKFRRSEDAAKSASFPSDSKLNRHLKNIASSDRATPKQIDVLENGSPFNQSRQSLDSVDYSFSGMKTSALPSPTPQNRSQDSLMKHLSLHQDNIIKSFSSQNAKILESNTAVLKAIGENRLMIQSFKKTLDLVLKELKDVKVSVKRVEEQQKETTESQSKLLAAFQTFQSINEDYAADEDFENGEYEDYGEEYEDGTPSYSQPLQTQTPLNVKTLPNFSHLQISPENRILITADKGSGSRGAAFPAKSKESAVKDVEVVYEKTPASELVQKAESLQLPSNFFSYLDKDECPGCRGCEQQQSVAGKPAAVSSQKPVVASEKPVSSSTPKPTLAPAKFQTSPLDSLTTCAPNVKPNSGVLAAPLFSFTPSTSTPKSDVSPATTTSAPKSVFGSQSTTTAAPFVFGGFGNQSSSAVYGTPDTTSAPKVDNIFSSAAKAASSTTPSEKPADKAVEAKEASKPGAGFQPPPASNGAPLMFGGNNLSDVAEKKAETTFGFKLPEGGGLFSSAAAATDSKTPSFGFKWGNDTAQPTWLSATPAPIFGQKPAAATNGKNNEDGDEEDGEEGEEEYDPQYAPIIEMPNLVEITTGEEDEEVVYSQRAKLYRYDKASKQWKERGVGDLKILKHRTKPRFRIVLRREQVHKIACNHYLTKDMKLTPMTNSDTAVCWFAMDFAEEEAAEEQFSVKFKNAELKKAFMDKFVSLQQQLPS